ncbi:MAG TPA: hypothetical protein VMY76_02020 [Gemmatimonadales bacterium]|nr:hypothetical protein [Gemmatimonadales bacterium]
MTADTPWAVWLLGLAFVASGTFVLGLPLVADEWAGFGIWERLGIVAIGVSHLAGGLWTIRHHAATRVELDRARGTGMHRVHRPGVRQAAVCRFRLADVRALHVREERDSDGDLLYAVDLVLSDGRNLPLQSHPAVNVAAARERAAEIRAFLGLATPASTPSLG